MRRHELLLGQDPSDIEILSEQTAVLMKINREQNLFTLFEGIFHSGDEEMKKLLAHHRLYEIQWLNERKAAMVSNLLVVLCGNKDAQPIVNSGSLY